MYNPLVKIQHEDSSVTYVRALSIESIQQWKEGHKVITKSSNYNQVTNTSEIADIIQSVEDRNEQSHLMRCDCWNGVKH